MRGQRTQCQLDVVHPPGWSQGLWVYQPCTSAVESGFGADGKKQPDLDVSTAILTSIHLGFCST